ncbi:unnamed protein product, partial [Symbiodinium natans]
MDKERKAETAKGVRKEPAKCWVMGYGFHVAVLVTTAFFFVLFCPVNDPNWAADLWNYDYYSSIGFERPCLQKWMPIFSTLVVASALTGVAACALLQRAAALEVHWAAGYILLNWAQGLMAALVISDLAAGDYYYLDYDPFTHRQLICCKCSWGVFGFAPMQQLLQAKRVFDMQGQQEKL